MNAYLEDPWLTAHIHCQAYRLDPEIRYDERTLSPVPPNARFVFGKIASSDIEGANALLANGFQFINTQVTLQKEQATQGETYANIRSAVAEDKNRIWDIALKSYSYDRFHLDEKLRPYADELNASWATNYFSGNRGTDMLVWESQGTIAGFLLLIVEDGVFDIDLVAVDTPFKRQGIARKLILAAEQKYSDCNLFSVITQMENVPATRMYSKLGYTISSLDMVFHRNI
ncbi:GNAT family N-acetyltransferase [Pseudodesulfovibrio cashew]|nr:GNAT family N-acetyltransferase [Pseudodesulfovibrio cashew]